MAFNKAKALENAQRLVSQGKLKEAIAEFQKVHKVDPNDQTTLNTLGDLNVRLKNVPEALNYYTKLADVYVSGGFLVRGIAMYKKINKLDPKNTRALERLAELYTMQGLMSEARSHYLQLGESLLKDGQANQAMQIMQKLLDLEPDNMQVQARLAALYERHHQKGEAASIYRRMGDRLLFKGEAEQSLEWLAKAAEIDPKDPKGLLLQARALQETGKAGEALKILERIPNPEENPEALSVLVNAKLGAGDTEQAIELAEKQFAGDPSQFQALLQVAQHAAEGSDAQHAVGILERISSTALENDPFNFLLAVRRVAECLPGSSEAASLLIEAGKRTGDVNAQIEGYQRQGKAAEAAGDVARAKEAYNEIVRLDPGNTDYIDQLNRVRESLGEDVTSAIEAATAAAETTGTTVVEEELDEETESFVTSSLADMDLFSNYGMPEQAVEKAREVLAKLPNHRETNEKLLDLYIGNSDEQGITEVAQRLESIYRQMGNVDRAEELAELASRYAEKASTGGAPAGTKTDSAAQVVEAEIDTAVKGGTTELDLTAEWTSLTSEEAPAETPAAAETPVFNAREASDEIAFYLDQGLVDQARESLANYERDFPNEPALAELRSRIEGHAQPAPGPSLAETVTEPSMEVPIEIPEAPPVEAPPPEIPVISPAEPEPFDSTGAVGGLLEDLASQLDEALAEKFELQEVSNRSADLVREVPNLPPVPAEEPETEATGVLADVLSEFRQDLGDEEEEVQDVETHYNLGVAYREMGLQEEAISEFQRAVKAAEKIRDYRHVAQSCILLAICFRERNMPKVATHWYDRALHIPGLDEEAALAIRFDMAEAMEEAGDHGQALDNFMQVYGVNVDYRNVGERIRSLQGF